MPPTNPSELRTDNQEDAIAPFPIVGIGASAGGLEAFEAFFRACPADTGMGFVLVPHLDPGHVSLLTEILQRSTAMTVVEARDQVAVAPNQVFVIPPNREMSIIDGVLQVNMPLQPRGQRMPIDDFLRALAKDQAERAIGIILSCTATDGTLGLRSIAAGYAHPCPAGRGNAGDAAAVTRHYAYRLGLPGAQPEKTLSGINQILQQLRSATGHDFSLYKKSTIGRRIKRRMVQHTIDGLAN